MNNTSEAILNCDEENLFELLEEVWHDEKPANPDEIDTDWKHSFMEKYADYINSYYDDVLNDPQLDPLIKQIIDYKSIQWQAIAKKVILYSPDLDKLIEKFEEEYEKEKWENMSDTEKAEHDREVEGDMQYDAYVDRLINGEL
jgi:hypothetical protein